MKTIMLSRALGMVRRIRAAVAARRGPSLHMYNWSDYINPDLVSAFREGI